MSEREINKLFCAFTNIDEDMIEEAQLTKTKKKTIFWRQWGIIAACLCLVITGTSILLMSGQKNNDSTTPATVYSLSQTDQMSVKLVSWQDEGFKGIVTCADEQNFFPSGAELTVIFESETEIILDDGTIFDFDDDEPKAGLVGWTEGTTIQVSFKNYEQYDEDNGYYNRIYASKVKAESNDLVYREYNSGFDIDSADGIATIEWNLPSDVIIDRIYLYCFNENTSRELTEEEIMDNSVTISESGHYLLYGMDKNGDEVDFTEYLTFIYGTKYMEDKTPFTPL